MHVGHRNERAIYNMDNHRIEEVEEEKDLGVLIHRTLSVSNNCCGSQESEPDGRTHASAELWHTRAYKLLYHCTRHWWDHIWSTAHGSGHVPYLKNDILSIEKVQRRVTKMIPSISALTYDERLKRTGLISVENRRLKADLLEDNSRFVKQRDATTFAGWTGQQFDLSG